MSFAMDASTFEAYGITNASATGPSYPSLISEQQIDPIFSYENFSRDVDYDRLFRIYQDRADENGSWDEPITRPTHERMAPAFALATKFIQHSQYFFYIVRNGQILTTNINGVNRRHFNSLPAFHPVHQQRIADQLTKISATYRFITGFTAAQIEASADTIHLRTEWTPAPALFNPNPNPHPPRKRAKPSDLRHLTSLPSDLFATIEGADWARLPASMRGRILFQLAVTLVHELAHALYNDRRWSRQVGADADAVLTDTYNDEPFFRGEGGALAGGEGELGNAWEVFFFGGLVECPVDGAFIGDEASGVSRDGQQEDEEEEEEEEEEGGGGGGGGGADIRIPTYAVQWRVSEGLLGGGVERLQPWDRDAGGQYPLVSVSVEEFFDPARWRCFDAAVASGTAGSVGRGHEAVRGMGESPFQVRLSPVRSRQTVLMDRGPLDNRTEEERKKPLQWYDRLLERCAEGRFSELPLDDTI